MNAKGLMLFEVTFKKHFGEQRWILANNFDEAVQKAKALMQADKELRKDEIGTVELQGTIDA